MLARVIKEGNEKKLQTISGSNASGIPLGTILPYTGKRCPTGFLPCVGQQFDRTQYPFLYKFLGTDILPDLRSKALIGYQDDPVLGKPAKLGEVQKAQLPAINGWFINSEEHEVWNTIGGAFYTYSTSGNGVDGSAGTFRYIRFDSSRNTDASINYLGENDYFGGYQRASGGAETRPANYRVNWIIKATTGIVEGSDESARVVQAIADAEALIKSDTLDTIETKLNEAVIDVKSYGWEEDVLLAGKETYRWQQDSGAYTYAPTIPANTIFTEPLTDFEEVVFKCCRSAGNHEQLPVWTIKTKDIVDSRILYGNASWHVMLPGYASEYKEYRFAEESLATISAVSGSANCWQISGRHRIYEPPVEAYSVNGVAYDENMNKLEGYEFIRSVSTYSPGTRESDNAPYIWYVETIDGVEHYYSWIKAITVAISGQVTYPYRGELVGFDENGPVWDNWTRSLLVTAPTSNLTIGRALFRKLN